MRWRAGSLLSLVAVAAIVLPLRAQDPPPAQSGPTPGSTSPAAATQAPRVEVVLQGVSYAAQRGVLYVNLRELAGALEWPLRGKPGRGALLLNGRRIPRRSLRRLPDGSQLVSLLLLREWGVTVEWDRGQREARAFIGDRLLRVEDSPKRVEINRSRQRLRAWQGGRLVLHTRVSTGRRGYETPRGSFRAGPLKTPLLISRKYDNARMPWTVQVAGDVCLHGHASVPSRPASHGCIRIPLGGGNPARWIYDWIDLGTPVVIGDRWVARDRRAAARTATRPPAKAARRADGPAPSPAAAAPGAHPDR